MRAPIRVWLWPLAATLLLASWQRYSGPTRPLPVRAEIGGKLLQFRLPRTHAGASDAMVRLNGAEGLQGKLEYRKASSGAVWTEVAMTAGKGGLIASLPRQEAAGKLEYRIQLSSGSDSVWLNGGTPAVIRFRGEVPPWILGPHIVCMFLGFLVAARAGLDGATGHYETRRVMAAVVLITAGGMILGPIVQKAAFGEYWTGWPIGSDLTDNKTAVVWLAWLAAAIWRKPRNAAIAAAVTFAVFAIPHSVLSGNVAR